MHPACPAAQRALYSTFYGNKLFTLRPNPRKEDVIDLLQASPRLCRRPLLGWLAGWLAGYGWLAGWLASWLYWLDSWLAGWLAVCTTAY